MINKNILLVEPGYPNKYPPLGLMKLAAYHGHSGRGDNVVFVKGPDAKVLLQHWDRVYVTTLFSFEWKKTSATIDFAINAGRGANGKGICWRNCRFVDARGLCGGAAVGWC